MRAGSTLRARRLAAEGQINIAVLASGSGTNLQALIDSDDLGATIGVVISDRPDAPALRRAESSQIPTRVIQWDDFPTREEFSNAVADAVENARSDYVVLAGFMRVLSKNATDRLSGRIINIHPSLLPAFPGMDAVAQALDAGVGETGVTVHVVDEKVDHGPIIAQRVVPVLEEDDAQSLHARIQVQEHDLLPEVVNALAEGRLQVSSTSVRWDS